MENIFESRASGFKAQRPLFLCFFSLPLPPPPHLCFPLCSSPPTHSFLSWLCLHSLSHRLHPILRAWSLVRDTGPASPDSPWLWRALCSWGDRRYSSSRFAQPRYLWRCGWAQGTAVSAGGLVLEADGGCAVAFPKVAMLLFRNGIPSRWNGAWCSRFKYVLCGLCSH